MVCIYCGSKTEIINSRFNKRTNATWRRRSCPNCGAIVSTYETVDLAKSWRVAQSKKASQLQDFSRDRLLLSVYKSLAHRPAAVTDASELSKTIIAQLAARADHGLLFAHQIASEILVVLKNFDDAAATHYQAFHKKSLAEAA
jgi:transcriptional regulator NrdR family protein